LCFFFLINKFMVNMVQTWSSVACVNGGRCLRKKWLTGIMNCTIANILILYIWHGVCYWSEWRLLLTTFMIRDGTHAWRFLKVEICYSEFSWFSLRGDIFQLIHMLLNISHSTYHLVTSSLLPIHPTNI